MKRFLSVSLGLLSGISAALGAKGPEVTNVEPPYWWTGMKNDTLQVMLTGPGIASANASVDYKGVRLAEQVNLDSPDYKLLYFVIGKETVPGTMEITLTDGKKRSRIPYQLRQRDPEMAKHGGFDASDVLYLLMPDRFAKGNDLKGEGLTHNVPADRSKPNGRHGGDLKGIENHLDYLDSLGVTALWFCPVLENDMPGGSYHGYSTTNYYKIDPRFGSNEEYAALIEKAHGKGLKVVMDMIFNHCGVAHPWIKNPPSGDWINHPEKDVMTNFRLTTVHDPYASDYDLDHTVNGWFVPSMPDLNQRNPHLMKYLIQNSIWWIESAKIDGIRMDTYPYADAAGMAAWNKAVRDEYPNFNIVGECWYTNEAGSAFWQKGNRLNPSDPELPTVMDFFFLQNGRKAFNSDTDPWGGLNMVYEHLSQDFLYPDPQHILTFLDNHDSDRFLLELPDSLGSWKQAQTFLLTSRGIPQIYYGTEILMNGSKEGSDGFVRKDMPGGFPGDEVNAFTPEGRTPLQNEAWDFLSKLLNWRRGEANEVIAKGKLKHFIPQDGLYVYTRSLGDKSVTVLLNGKDEPVSVSMARTEEVIPVGSSYRDIISGDIVTIEKEMTFSPRQIMILQNF